MLLSLALKQSLKGVILNIVWWLRTEGRMLYSLNENTSFSSKALRIISFRKQFKCCREYCKSQFKYRKSDAGITQWKSFSSKLTLDKLRAQKIWILSRQAFLPQKFPISLNAGSLPFFFSSANCSCYDICYNNNLCNNYCKKTLEYRANFCCI